MYRVLTPPAGLPITMAALKAHLRIDHDDENDLLVAYAGAATAHLETVLNRHLLNTTVEQILPSFPMRWPIELRGRVQQIISLAYRDSTGVLQTLPPETYWLNSYCEPALVSLAINQAWPGSAIRDDAVVITYISGYGETPEDVPESLRHAVLLLAANWYENRTTVSIGASVSRLPFGVECLISPFKLWAFN